MGSLAVDKVEKRVVLNLSDGAQYNGFFFLAPFSELGVGRQTIKELLTQGDVFIPFRTLEGENWLISRRRIVRVVYDRDGSEAEAPELAGRRSIMVHMLDGGIIKGEITLDMPSEKSRLSDYLNNIDQFVLLVDGGKEYLINLDYIIKVS